MSLTVFELLRLLADCPPSNVVVLEIGETTATLSRVIGFDDCSGVALIGGSDVE